MIVIRLDAPLDTAKLFVRYKFTEQRTGKRTLLHHKLAFYSYTGYGYREISNDQLRTAICEFLADCWYRTDKEEFDEVKPDLQMVANALDALRAATHLNDEIEALAWLASAIDLPAEEMIACQNGLLHLPTMALLSHTPDFFTHNALEFGFENNAEPPTQWLLFLKSLWGDDDEAISTLQEIFGYCLLADTRRHKVFMIIGAPRSGKGTIARILRKLIGEANYSAPTLGSLSEPFGLQRLINKLVAIVSDARISGRSDQDAIVERLLAISGEDGVNINRKNIIHWTGELKVRFVILANLLPRLNDPSGAFATWVVMLKLSKSFLGCEDLGLLNRSEAELPAIPNWSIEGWRRLRERGYFLQPQSSRDLTDQLEALSSPIRAFVGERCMVGAGLTVPVDDVFRAWQTWSTAQGRAHPGDKQTFGRNLRGAYAGIKASQPRAADGGRFRAYEGIRLTDAGQAEAAKDRADAGKDFNTAPRQRDGATVYRLPYKD